MPSRLSRNSLIPLSADPVKDVRGVRSGGNMPALWINACSDREQAVPDLGDSVRHRPTNALIDLDMVVCLRIPRTSPATEGLPRANKDTPAIF